MADVGRSTTGRVSRREIMYPEGHEALLNWGAFQRGTDDGSPGTVSADPIFREVMSGYRESAALRYIYDEDYALLVDQLLGHVLHDEEVYIATLAYAIVAPSDRAVTAMEKKHPRPSGGKWTRDEYRRRVDEVTARLDMVVRIAMNKDAARAAARSGPFGKWVREMERGDDFGMAGPED